jgi:hypothetical protein
MMLPHRVVAELYELRAGKLFALAAGFKTSLFNATLVDVALLVMS